MSEQITRITKETLLPIGMTISIITAIAWGSWQLSSINTRLQLTEQRINDTPTIQQFEDLKITVDEVRTDVKTLVRNK